MSKPTLYYLLESPPCRTVMAVANMLHVDMDLKLVDLKNKEHLNPEYLKLNPFHKVPTFVDADGFVLDESRAIATYLIQSRKPDSALYPVKDLKKRSQIDRWLQYDCGTLFMMVRAPLYEKFHHGKVNETTIQSAKETLKTLEDYMATLNKTKFVTGSDEMTVADVSMYFSCNLLEVCPEYNLDDYPHLKSWYNHVAESLKPFDPQGLFPKAIDSMKKYIESYKHEH